MSDEITLPTGYVGNDRQVAYCACCRFAQRLAADGFIECHRQSPAPACALVPFELARTGNLVAVCAYPVRPDMDFCGDWEEGTPRAAAPAPAPTNLLRLPQTGLIKP
jgi:hypothetical protein